MDDRKRSNSLRFIVLTTLAFACGVMASPALFAHHEPGHHGSDIAECDCPPGIDLVSDAWVRLLQGGRPNTGAYMTLRNKTDDNLYIVAAESPAAERVELHDHVHDPERGMRMREVERIVIPANGEVELRLGGKHLMLIDLVEPLEEGQSVPITLYVDGFEDVRIDARVSATPPSD